MALITTDLNGDGARGVAYKGIKNQAANSKAYLQRQMLAMQQPVCDSLVPLQVIVHFGQVVDQFNAWAATPGLGAYAQAQEADPTYDVIANFNAMMASFTSVRDTLIGMFPKDGNGFLLYQTLNASGQISSRTFTAAQLASAVALIATAVATIA